MKKRALFGAAVSACVLILQPMIASAATPAGSIIRNQAEATYFDPVQDRAFSVTSTIATIRVRSAPDFELLVDNDIFASADETVSFAHTVRNTGNETDQYTLSYDIPPTSDPLLGTAIFHDLNENGVLDPNEPEITETPILQSGESIELVLVGRVPPLANPGQAFMAEVKSTSLLDMSNTQIGYDRVEVTTDQPLRISKSSFPACSVPIIPGEVIDYEVDLLNIDQLGAHVRDYVIDGQIRRGFVIDDTIPANTTLVAGGAIAHSPQDAELVVRPANYAETSYISYTNYNGLDPARSVGLFIPEERLAQGQSGQFSFQVRLSEGLTPGTIVTNAILVDLEGDGITDVQSNQTCNTINVQGAQADLRFVEPAQTIRTALSTGSGVGPQHSSDSDYADAPVYRLDTYPGYIAARDGVYLEVRSTALNTAAYISEDEYGDAYIRVRVQSSDTGDTLYVRLRETGPNTGLFRSEIPFQLSESGSGQGRDCAPSIVEQCLLSSVSGDRLLASIFDPGTQIDLTDLAVVDPLGIVFDSTSLDPVPGAEVQILDAFGAVAINPDTGLAFEPQITGSDGRYTIPRLAPGQYEIFVTTPQDYTFASIVDPNVFAGRRMVDQRSYGGDGYSGVAGAGMFDAGFVNASPVIDVPIDPDLTLGQLSLEKDVSRDVASFGDTLTYTLTTRNGTEAVLLDAVIVDAPAAGFRFVTGSATLNGEPLEEVSRPDPRSLAFAVGRLEIGETAVVTYRLQVGPETPSGERVNLAVTTARTGGFIPAISPRARAEVRIRDDGLLSDRAYLVGSVWADEDMDGVRGELEVGLPGARVWLEDGTWVETDELGRYSLYGLQPGLRIARLDPDTLPDGYEAHATVSRQMGSGDQRFVDLTAGDLHRADFPLSCPNEDDCGIGSAFATLAGERASRQSPDAMLDQALAYEGLIGETVSRDLSRLREQPGPDGDVSNGLLNVSGAPGLRETQADTLLAALDAQAPSEASGPLDPETAAATLGRIDVNAGTWLWPLPDARTGEIYARDGRVMVAVRQGMDPVLYVDGEAAATETLGAVIENREQEATVAAWYGVSLTPGPHTLEVRGEDMFGNQRVLATAEIVRPGSAVRLNIETPQEQISADGRSVARLVIRALDDLGAPASGNHFITLEASVPGSETRVSFAGQDVQPSQPGHQVRLKDGAAQIGIIAPETPGEVRISATDKGVLEAETRVRFSTPMRDLIAVGLVELNASRSRINGALEPVLEELSSEAWETDNRAAVFLKGRIKGDALLTLSYDSEKSRSEGLFRDIDPEAYYPIYGDSSEKGFEAQSRSKLYVRLEKGASSIMWGDYRTDAYSEDSLVRTRRALTGANAYAENGDWTFQAFAAEASKTQRSERIRGGGLALDISLPGAPLLRNSEVLTIETRDRNNPGLIVRETTLVRYADYLLDDVTGKLTLKAPLASFDEDLNPIFLLATYEVDDGESDALVAGVRARRSGQLGAIWAGLTYDEAQSDVERRMFGSIGAERRFDAGRVYAEIGVSDNHTDLKSSGMGEAFRAGLEAEILGGSLTAEYAQADADFDNVDAPILAGRRETRSEYVTPLGSKAALKAAGYMSEDLKADSRRAAVQALVVTQVNDWTVSAGPRLTSDETSDAKTEFASAILRLDKPMTVFKLPATTHVEIEKALSDDRTRLQVGGDVLVGDKTRLYANHRFLDELPDQTFAPGLTQDQGSLQQQKTIFGVESSLLPGTDIYGEWREPGALDQGTGEAAYGIRAQWDIVEGLSIAPHLEIVDTIEASVEEETSTFASDSVALSLAIADRRFKDSRRSARVEMRNTDTSTFYAARAGWAQRFTPMWTGAVKVDASRDNISGAENMEHVRFTTGLARRPADAEKTDWFALYQLNSELEAGDRRYVQIVSGHANRQFGDRWTWSGRAVAKWEDAIDGDSSAQLVGGRVLRNISDKIDLEARGSVRAVQWGDAYQSSFGLAGSYQAHEHVRLTLGYNLTGFQDHDLDPAGYDAQGVYWNIGVAIDEDWFGWLRPE